MQEVAQLIGTVGFPIVAFLLMFWWAKSESKENREVIARNTEMMAEVLAELRKKSSD